MRFVLRSVRFGIALALLALLSLGCPTTGGPPGEPTVDDDQEQDFYDIECPDCTGPGEPVPDEVP